MEFNIPSYATTFLERQFKAIGGTDFTLDAGGAIIAWNTLKGVQPTEAEISAGAMKLIKQDMVSRVNNLSGEIRNSYLSDGLFVVEEYRLAEVEALDYKARNFQDAVPTTILDYAQVLGTTDYALVANSILAAATQLKTILTLVRKIRLTATTAITASTSLEGVVAAHSTAVASLEYLRKPV